MVTEGLQVGRPCSDEFITRCDDRSTEDTMAFVGLAEWCAGPYNNSNRELQIVHRLLCWDICHHRVIPLLGE